MNIEEKDFSVKLEDSSRNIISKIVDENNSDSFKDLVNLFNMNQQKKNILRSNAYSNLLDIIVDELNDRISNNTFLFSNKDLLDSINTINNAINKSSVDVENISIQPIQTNTQINVNVDNKIQLDRDSKERITNVVNTILKSLKNTNNAELVIDTEVADDKETNVAD